VAGISAPANFNLTNTAGGPATIIAAAGTPQSAAINTAFTVPLAASVLDANSNPVAGIVVTFTAPTSGATGIFAGSTNIAIATTDSSGVASAPTFTSNEITGSYSVTASIAGISTPVSFSLTNRVAGN